MVIAARAAIDLPKLRWTLRHSVKGAGSQGPFFDQFVATAAATLSRSPLCKAPLRQTLNIRKADEPTVRHSRDPFAVQRPGSELL